MSVTEKLSSITKILCELSEDAEKTNKGNASAGRRVRKTCMQIIHELRELRSEVLKLSKKEKES